MIMCAQCKKKMAVIFVTRVENGEKVSRGLCMKCAGEAGLPVKNMMEDICKKFGINREQAEGMEDEMDKILGLLDETPSDADDNEDGGAPAVDFPKFFGEDDLSDPEKEKSDDSPATESRSRKIGESAPGNNHTGKKRPDEKKNRFLHTYCRNLTKMAQEGKLDTIVGREKELARLIQILCRRQKNNPCLIGEPGVGKTAIAEALAIKIANDDVPHKLSGKQVYLVDLTALIAGTQFRGQFEQRILGLLNEVKEAGNVILVIDEVHNIVGAGNSEGSMNAANILKPALSRGEIQLIGTTTLNEYRKYIEKDSALERRFQPVTVNEPSLEETVEMLREIKHYYEEFHAIHIPDAVLHKAVALSERYITDRYLPDKAIDLLDEAASYLSLNSAELNESYFIRDKLIQLKNEREEREQEVTADDKSEERKFEQIANLRGQELMLSNRLRTLEPVCKSVTLGVGEIANVIEIWTGIPATNINENEYERLNDMETRLKKRIIGQDEAVSAVVRAIKRNRAGISYKRKPVSFIFAGPTGVGKTELVKTLANDLFHSPETLVRLDMSEYMEKEAVSRLIGAPPGYVGFDDAGQLTEKIRRRPYSIVLFDEIEKAHPDVLNVLLQILDDGRVTDAQGRTVNFENAVIVMTTNAGSDHTGNTAGFAPLSRSVEESRTEKALEGFLRPEFINRVDEVITFRSLSKEDFTHIVGIMLGDLQKSLAEKNIDLHWSDAAAMHIAQESYSQKFGARNMRRYIQREVEDRLAELIIADYRHVYTIASIDATDGKLMVACL